MQRRQTDPTFNKKHSHDARRTVVMPHGILETLKQSSNQVLQKNPDDSLMGVRYTVMVEPSSLRPVRSWTILIEQWECKTMADIVAKEVLFLRIANVPNANNVDYADIISNVVIHGEKRTVDKRTAFSTVMAAGVLINKVDVGRLPDIETIFRTYNVD